MQSNILIDLLQRSVDIKGIDVGINSDFRTSILFELMMQDNSITNEEKLLQAVDLYFPDLPKDVELDEVIESILWFYRSGHEEVSNVGKSDGNNQNKKNQIYCFEQDADYIYAAFLDQYGIDLQDVEYLHWWKFKAMFKSLKSDNEIVKIMEYRSVQITNDMSKQQKVFYKKMKQLYKLKDTRTELEKEKMVADTLSSLF